MDITPDAGGVPASDAITGGGGFGLTGSDNFDLPRPLGSVVPETYVPPTLAPGTYWLMVTYQPECGASRPPSPTPWYWRTVSPQAGHPAVWSGQSPSASCQAGIGGVSWKPLADCGKPGPDLAFRLSGQLGTATATGFSVSRKLSGRKLRVQVPGAGKVAVTDASSPSVLLSAQTAKKTPLIKPTTVNAARAGTVTVKLKLTRAAKTKLRQKGKVRLHLRVAYKPSGGSTSSKLLTVLVKRKK